jgi:hypothetical protein
MGVAFHPEFAANRRFFVSYTCDTTTSPECVRSTGTTSGNGSTTYQGPLWQGFGCG